MSNYRLHALNEFRAAGWIDGHGIYCDEMQEAICEHVLRLLRVFAREEHSGSSAPYAIDVFSKLAKFEPITPLTGEDWEWVEVGVGMYQNKRCSSVFKQSDRLDGQAYYIDGKVFWSWYKSKEDGTVFKSHYTSSESRVTVTFPYTPKTEYVFVPTVEFPNETLL